MLRTAALLLSALLLPSLAFAAGGDGYRLAGVLAVGPEYLAIVELPSGQQQLARKGTTLADGASVVLVDARRLRISHGGRTIELQLDPSGRAAEVPVALGVVQEQIDHDGALVRRVDPAAFSASAAQSGRASPAATAAPASGSGRRDPAAETGRRLAPILNLPSDSRVVAVNEQPVRSAEQAIRLIEQSLAENTAPRLNITSAAGDESRVYLSVAEP
jgi:hypothetical protein